MNNQAICTQCVMDNSDPDLILNENNICHYCISLAPFYEQQHHLSDTKIHVALKKAKKYIHHKNSHDRYDCILGLSGGVDSSFTAHFLVREMGLKPLIVHFDNGWNSAIAVENIHALVTQLKLDMVTEIIDWEEFKDLQRAFIKAHVLDIEMLTDHAIYGTIIKMAKKHGIKCVVSGENYATESGLPSKWRWEKLDAKNILAIHRLYGEKPLKNMPIYSPWQLLKDRLWHNIHYFYPLNMIRYQRGHAVNLLKQYYGWQDYGSKHGESHFTKFYQNYILPKKFGIDKRKAHFSSLIRNKELLRSEALEKLSKPSEEENNIRQELNYILKKLQFSHEEFATILATKARSHLDYASHAPLLEKFKKLANLFKLKVGKFP